MDVVALLAHPDDELMCAGTLARLVDKGHNVTLWTLFVNEREPEWRAACDAIGCKSIRGRASEDEFAWTRKDVRRLESFRAAPDLLISHRANDDNTSHGHIGRIARTFARKNRTTLWEIDQTLPGGLTDHPQPNLLVNISDQAARKDDAVHAYKSQLARYPRLESAILYRDLEYGWSVGVGRAEGFTVRKAVWL